MTYCIGFKNDKAVFLVADGLISEQKNINVESSFGKYSTTGRLLEDDTTTFTESLQKVRMISEGVLATFSGSVDTALNALEHVKTLINEGSCTPETAFNTALIGVKDIRVLFTYIVNNESKLYSYNLRDNGKITEHLNGEIVGIGSGIEYSDLHKQSVALINNLIANSNNNPSELLALVLGGLIKISSKLLPALNYQVGGNFFGGFVDETASHMMKDTLYLFYGFQNGEIKVAYEMSILNSSNMNLVYSTFSENNHGMFFGYANDININSSKEFSLLFEDYKKGKVDFAIGIDVLNDVYFLCKQEDYPNFLFRSLQENGDMQIGLPPKLVKKIEEIYSKNILESKSFLKIII